MTEILAKLKEFSSLQRDLMSRMEAILRKRNRHDEYVQWGEYWDDDLENGKITFRIIEPRHCSCCSDEESDYAISLEELFNPEQHIERLEREAQEAREARDRKMAADQQAALEAKEAQERAEYARLKEKFGELGKIE